MCTEYCLRVYVCIQLEHEHVSKGDGGMTSKDLIKLLEQSGCVLVRQGKGSHHIYYSPLTQKKFPVPHPKGSIPIGTLKSIKKMAGI